MTGSTSNGVEVRRLKPDEWEIARDIRLAALADSPSAFASTLAREQKFSEHTWRQRLAESLCVVAFRTGQAIGRGEPIGLAGCYVGDSGAELISMWVAPHARGSAAADALVNAVCEWAVDEGHVTLALWVVSGNDVAERFYARNGFLRTGREQPVRNGLGGTEIEMIRLLAPPSVP